MVGAARFELATPGPPERQLLCFQCFLLPQDHLFSLEIRHSDGNRPKRWRDLGLNFGLNFLRNSIAYASPFPCALDRRADTVRL